MKESVKYPAAAGEVGERKDHKGRLIVRRVIRISLILLLLLPGVFSLFREDYCRFPANLLIPALLLPESDSPVKVLYYGHDSIAGILPGLTECVGEVRRLDSKLPADFNPDLILLERLPQLRTVSDRKFLKELAGRVKKSSSVLVLPLRCAAALPPEFQCGVLLPDDNSNAASYIAVRSPEKTPPATDAVLLEQRWLKRFNAGQRPLAGIFQAVYPEPWQQVKIGELRRNSAAWQFSINIWWAVVPAVLYFVGRVFLRRNESFAGGVDRMENAASLLLAFCVAIYYAAVWTYMPGVTGEDVFEFGGNILWLLAGITPLFVSWKRFGSARSAVLAVIAAVLLWNNEIFSSGVFAHPLVVFLQWFLPLPFAAAAAGAVSAIILRDLPQAGRAGVFISTVAGVLPVIYVIILFMAYGRIEIVLAAATVFRLAGLQRCAES